MKKILIVVMLSLVLVFPAVAEPSEEEIAAYKELISSYVGVSLRLTNNVLPIIMSSALGPLDINEKKAEQIFNCLTTLDVFSQMLARFERKFYGSNSEEAKVLKEIRDKSHDYWWSMLIGL
jgi:hypothetical protein